MSGRRGSWWCLACVGWLLGAAALVVEAQQVPRPPGLAQPRLYTVQPAGARAGTTVEVVVRGTDLDQPEALWFSHPGLKATVIGEDKPAEPAKDSNRRRGMNGPTGPLTAWKFSVTVDADVPPGLHDVRLVDRHGVSNPRAFAVGDRPEVVEREPNDDVASAQDVTLETTIHGAISSPTDVDDYVVQGRRGQRILAIGITSSLDSRCLLGLELYDRAGKKLAAAHEYRGSDALLDVELPADGAYLLRAFAFTYSQGGPEHFYRLSVTTAPWIDAIFPPVLEAGKATKVTIFGRNLQGGRIDPGAVVDGRPLETLEATIEAPREDAFARSPASLAPSIAGLEGFTYRVKNAAGVSNDHVLTLTRLPVILDAGGNDTPETAQEVKPPCEIAGRIEARRDRDWYAFEARKGDVLSIEAFGQRIGSPLDLYLVVRNAQSKQALVELDEDDGQRGQGQNEQMARLQFFARTEDPGRYRFVAPADGRYELMISSREAPSVAGPRHLYRVWIAPEQPDFQLVTMPGSPYYPEGLVLRRGGEAEIAVFALRQDGFADEIALSAKDLPPGVTCAPQVIGTGRRSGALVLSVTPDAAPWLGSIRIEGSARIGDRTVVREARAATISWPVPPQSNTPAISRLDRGLVAAIRDQAPFRLVAETHELTVTHGEKATIPLKVVKVADGFDGKLQNPAVANVSQALAGAINVTFDKDEGKATLDIKPTVPPGVYSLVFRAQGQIPVNADPKAKDKSNAAVTQPSTPVTLTIRAKELARVTLAPGNPTAKPGQAAEVTVRLARQFGYAGAFDVELILPDDVKDLKAERVTIPPGQDEVKLRIAVDPEAKPGNRANLVVRAVTRFPGDFEVRHEAKFNLNVAK